MPISQVQLANTFNQFRQTVNDIANTVNGITGGGGPISANTVTAGNLTQNRVLIAGASGLITDDSAITYNPTTDILTLNGTTDASSPITGTLVVSGGVGVAKKLYVGTDLRVSGTTTFEGNVIFLGSNTEVSTTQLNLNDPLIQLANNNVTDAIDIGIFGQYNSGSGNVHSGIFRDATDGIWKIFKNYNVEPTTIIDPTTNNFAYADLSLGSLIVNTNANVVGTLSVTGVTSLTNNLNINTNKFNVTASSGNTAIAGTLNVTDATTLANTLALTGNFAVNTNKFNVTASSGNTSIAGTLTVTDATTLSSTLALTNNLNINTNKFNVTASSGNTAIAGTLNVTGATTLSGNTAIAGTLTVTELATFSKNININGNTTLGSSSSNTITINGSTLTLSTNLNVNSGKYFFDQANTRFGINTSNPSVSLDINKTDGIKLPVGTTGERPTGQTGIIRYNSTDSRPEIYSGGTWRPLGGAAGGESFAYAYFIAANI